MPRIVRVGAGFLVVVSVSLVTATACSPFPEVFGPGEGRSSAGSGGAGGHLPCSTDGDCGGAQSGRVCDKGMCADGCRGSMGNGCPDDKQLCTSTDAVVGQCVQCVTPNDCGTATVCKQYTCVDHICGAKTTTPGTPIASQVYGDCTTTICDSEGEPVSATDLKDTYDDGGDCVVLACQPDGKTARTWLSAGTACLKAKGLCDGNGACVECLASSDCTVLSICLDGRCLPSHCKDGVQNVGETDVDCGGPCSRCPDGEHCKSTNDCTSRVCMGTICQPATCMDGTANGNETDVDCGGPDCPTNKCTAGQACKLPTDCDSGVCEQGKCQAPSCTDGVKNGAETSVDCGGPCDPPCPP